ncbi:hypothetical protein D3C75_1088290 [compost metagenome]
MPQQLLNGPQVCPLAQQHGREGMTQLVAGVWSAAASGNFCLETAEGVGGDPLDSANREPAPFLRNEHRFLLAAPRLQPLRQGLLQKRSQLRRHRNIPPFAAFSENTERKAFRIIIA